MRNIWYPRKQAEYMTTARFAELGLTNDSIGERDPLFGVSFAREGVEETEEVDAAARPIVEGVSVSLNHLPDLGLGPSRQLTFYPDSLNAHTNSYPPSCPRRSCSGAS